MSEDRITVTARAVVAEYGDDEDSGPEDKIEAAEVFGRVFGRAPDPDEDAWSLVVAAANGEG